MADKKKDGDGPLKAGEVVGALPGGLVVYVDAEGRAYRKVGDKIEYTGARYDMKTGEKVADFEAGNLSFPTGLVKPQPAMAGVLTHDDYAAIPIGAKGVIQPNGRITYSEEGSSKQYSINTFYVDVNTGKTYKSKEAYEKAKAKSDAKLKADTLKFETEKAENEKKVTVEEAPVPKGTIAAPQSAIAGKPDSQLLSPAEKKAAQDRALNASKDAYYSPSKGVYFTRAKDGKVAMPMFMDYAEQKQYRAAAASNLIPNSDDLQGISVLVGTVKKAASRPDQGGTGAVPGDAPYGYIDAAVKANGKQMMYKLQMLASTNKTAFQGVVDQLIGAGYLDPKDSAGVLTSAVAKAYAEAIKDYGTNYAQPKDGDTELKNYTTFTEFMDGRIQYNKDNQLGIFAPTQEELTPPPVRQNQWYNEEDLRSAATAAFQEAAGRVDPAWVDSFVNNLRQRETAWNDQVYDAQMAQYNGAQAVDVTDRPSATAAINQAEQNDPALAGAIQSMNTGKYLQIIQQMAGGMMS